MVKGSVIYLLERGYDTRFMNYELEINSKKIVVA